MGKCGNSPKLLAQLTERRAREKSWLRANRGVARGSLTLGRPFRGHRAEEGAPGLDIRDELGSLEICTGGQEFVSHMGWGSWEWRSPPVDCKSDTSAELGWGQRAPPRGAHGGGGGAAGEKHACRPTGAPSQPSPAPLSAHLPWVCSPDPGPPPSLTRPCWPQALPSGTATLGDTFLTAGRPLSSETTFWRGPS